MPTIPTSSSTPPQSSPPSSSAFDREKERALSTNSPRRPGSITSRVRQAGGGSSGGGKRAHPRRKKTSDNPKEVEAVCQRVAQLSDPHVLSELLVALIKAHPELARDACSLLEQACELHHAPPLEQPAALADAAICSKSDSQEESFTSND